ncbi:TPA: hypothetical protein U2M23_002781 [Providencia stuartii]|nr:hypothetical protein [Providencia stuartii]HEM8189943.1 hypothetical protein [Providencia stuartii]HEM8220098.1 hypothetical protein [Providencia stuartii]
MLAPVRGRDFPFCTPAQNPTPFVCGRGGGASARKGVDVSRAGYGVISSLMVLFAIIQAVQPR